MYVGATKPLDFITCLGVFNWHAVVKDVIYNIDSNHRPVSSGDYAEVTHCGGSRFESHGAWHYVLRGAGMYVNVGKTIAFQTHEDASLYFLNTPCTNRRNTDHHGNPECDEELDTIMIEARRNNYTSLQFLHHCDAFCFQCPHELVMLGFNGSTPCPLQLQYYDFGKRKCKCVPWNRSLRGSCAGCTL
jgi:hypothetical protein